MYVCMCSGVWHVCLCVFSYCLQPEDSQMDARMTCIQQHYLLSERASNCSSSNTPEVKVEQYIKLMYVHYVCTCNHVYILYNL